MKLKLHGTATYTPATQIGPAEWNHHDLFLVKQGSLRFVTSSGELKLCANDAVWIPPKTRFSAKSLTESSTIWVVHFANPRLDPSKLTVRNPCGVWHFPGGVGDLTNKLMVKLQELYIGNSIWQNSAMPYFNALLQDLGENARRLLTSMTYSLDELTRWARENLPKRIGVRDLAERAGLSEVALRQFFQIHLQQSPGEYLRQLRMSEAGRLLLQTTDSIKQICAAVGYSEVAAFNHAFSEFFKVSPGVYRSSRREIIA